LPAAIRTSFWRAELLPSQLCAHLHLSFSQPHVGASGTFWIYAGICALGFVYLALRLPETKGKSLEAIEQSWS
jgi:Sugar (and other) transporter